MSIREFHPIPRDLPPAKLYLDDIEEVVKVFIEAADFSKVGDGVSPKASFGVKNFDCDTIEELQQIGHTKTNVLGIYVDLGQQEVGRLEIRKGHPASWNFGRGMRKEDRFKVYGQLHAMFHLRRIRWKYAVWSVLFSIPPWFYFLFIIPPVLFTLRDILVNKVLVHGPHAVFWLAFFFILWVPLSLLMTYKTVYEQSFVVFRRVHDDQGFRKKWLEWRPYIIAAIVGGVVKELFDVMRKAIEK